MYYTAVDWSGDPGIPSANSGSTAQLVFAFVTIEATEREHLHAALEAVRRKHHKTDRFVFHFVDCPTDIASSFFHAVGAVELQVRIGVIKKDHDWTHTDFLARTGQQRLLDSLVGYSILVPTALVSGSTLLIDAPRTEKKFVLTSRRAIRTPFHQMNLGCFRDIRPCPDGNDPDGEVVQVADMVAGAVRRAGTMANPHIRLLERRLFDWEER
jgi:hypothetical protein